MNLVIQIRDGQPHEHPILIENFITAFPHLDLTNLPPTFAKFERIPRPIEGPYEELINVSYQWVGDVVKDVWEMRQFTEQEKIDKQNFVKAKFAELFPNMLSWTFDETRCAFVCPVSYPTDSETYVWQEDTQRWTHITDLPSLANRTPEDPPIIVGREFVTF